MDALRKGITPIPPEELFENLRVGQFVPGWLDAAFADTNAYAAVALVKACIPPLNLARSARGLPPINKSEVAAQAAQFLAEEGNNVTDRKQRIQEYLYSLIPVDGQRR